MKNLTEIIAGDLRQAGLFTRGMIKGVFHGLYTPFLLNTGGKHFINNFNEEIGTEAGGDLVGQLVSVVLSPYFLINYAASQGRLKEYCAAMIASNTINYLVHAYKRAKPPT